MKQVALPGYEKNVQNYIDALEAMGLTAVVTLDTARAASCGGLLLPGGGDIDPVRFGQENRGSNSIDPALDRAQMAILDGFVRARKPVLGICRGHQVINVYFGGDLIQDLPEAEEHMAHDHVDSLHPVTIAPGSLLWRLYGGRAVVNSAHHQGLGRLGRGLRAAAAAPDGVNEAVWHESLPILGVQFHPERMAFRFARPDTADGERVFRWFREQMSVL